MPAPTVALDAIETMLAELIPRLAPAPRHRGRPAILPTALFWAAILVCILRGTPRQRAVWRLVTGAGLWDLPAVTVSAEAVRQRMLHAGPASMHQLFQDVTAELQAAASPDLTLAPFATGVFALDASTLDQVARTLPALCDVPAGDVQLLPGKLHTVFEVRRQLFCTVQPSDLPRQHERVVAADLVRTLPPGSMILADLGYFSFPWFDDLTDQGYCFVSKLRQKLSYEVVHVLTAERGLRDELIWLGTSRADRTKHLLRLLTVPVGPSVRRYVTTVRDPHTLPIAEVVRLYARRWDIELAFKLVKRELGLHLLWSASWEQLLLQVWATLVIAQVAFATRAELAARAEVDLFDISLALVLRDLPRYVHRGAPDVLAAIVARGKYGGIIRPSTRRRETVPRDVVVTPPPRDLPLTRTPRYARKNGRPDRQTWRLTQD